VLVVAPFVAVPFLAVPFVARAGLPVKHPAEKHGMHDLKAAFEDRPAGKKGIGKTTFLSCQLSGETFFSRFSICCNQVSKMGSSPDSGKDDS
jgi:hypothetical protein